MNGWGAGPGSVLCFAPPSGASRFLVDLPFIQIWFEVPDQCHWESWESCLKWMFKEGVLSYMVLLVAVCSAHPCWELVGASGAMTAIHFFGSVSKLEQDAAFIQIADAFHQSTAKMPQAGDCVRTLIGPNPQKVISYDKNGV